MRSRIGIVGGYGSTGRAVVSELRASCDAEIVVGGRDLAKAEALAAEFDGRVSAKQVDVFEAGSLDRFCSGCSIVVNCAGPVMQLQDRVAQAAFRNRCHYVDVAGMSLVMERMLSHAQEISNRGLSFVVSAGWLPGLTELVPVYAHALAKKKMDAIERVTVYLGDSGEWSESAIRDGAWFLRKTGLPGAPYFRRGERARARMSEASPKVDLGGRLGKRRFSLFAMPEQEAMARTLNDCDVFAYSYLASPWTAMAGAMVALLPLPERWSVGLLRGALRSGSLPVGGFVVARVNGISREHQKKLSVELTYDKKRDYWMNGFVAGTVARLLSERKGVQRGLRYFADAVDPSVFMGKLRGAGVEAIDRLDPAEGTN